MKTHQTSPNHAHRFTQALQHIRTQHNLRLLRPYAHENVYVRDDDKHLLNFASNDYLGLQILWRERIVEFLQHTSHTLPYLSSSSSRLLSGDFPIFSQLESLIAHLYGRDCLLFNSGYHANVGLLQALSKLDNTLFVIDQYAHASVFDGVRLAHAQFRRFAHNDMEALATLLESYHARYESIIIVSEALFSMDGDFAPLADLVRLKKCYDNVLLYLDEAHSVGAYGDCGLGLAHHLGYVQDVDFLILTFGKAISSVGACVLCHHSAKQYFINTARSLIYSTALPPLNVAFSHYVFAHLRHTDTYRIYLRELSEYMRAQLTAHIRDFAILGDAHIISILIGENDKTLSIAHKLQERGIFAPAIRYPTIPKGSARIRFCVNAAMERAHIDTLCEIMCEVGR